MKTIITLMIPLLLMGCSHVNDPHDHDAAPAESEDQHTEAETFLLFSDHIELFGEYSPMIVGEPSHILAHVTLLDGTYKPIEAGMVVASLNVEFSYADASTDKPISIGIFELELTPVEAGLGEIMFIVTTDSFSDTLFLDHIHVIEDAHDDHGHAHAGDDPSWVSFSKELAWKSNFNVEPVRSGPFSSIIKASGELLPMPVEKKNITAKGDGILIFENRALVQGSHVKKGDILFTLSGKGLADNNIQVEFNESRTLFEKSRSEYFRHKKLYAEKVISEKQYMESRTRYINDSVRFYSLEDIISDEGFSVYSPSDGYIHELFVTEGQFVSMGMLMATISSDRIILLRADVPQQYYSEIGNISDAHFRTAYSDRIYTLRSLQGRLLARGSSVAENNHYIPVYFEVVNDGTLLEGAYAEFFLIAEDRPMRITVPESSLLEEQNNYYLYVQKNGERFEKRLVTIGPSDGMRRVIRAGLKEGERVATRGAMLLKTASMSSMPVHSHSH